MTPTRPTIVTTASAAVSILVLSGCSGSDGSVSFRNYGTVDLAVSSGEDDWSVAAGVISELQADCTDGDVSIVFADGSVASVPGPVCSDQAVVIRDGTAELVASTTPA